MILQDLGFRNTRLNGGRDNYFSVAVIPDLAALSSVEKEKQQRNKLEGNSS